MKAWLLLATGIIMTAVTAPAEANCPSTWRAERWAKQHSQVSFALNCGGKIKGVRQYRPSNSASTGKALLLVSHLREHRPVAPVKNQLRVMITQSDNQAATSTYNRLGDRPLGRALKRMEMKDTRLCSCWASIKWSPREYSKLFIALPDALPHRHRYWAMGLFKNITPSQRWGIPGPARQYGFRSYLKGGWRPEAGGWIVLQGALLRKGKERMSLAVFTRDQASLEAGASKIKTITRLILKPSHKPTSKVRPKKRSIAVISWSGLPAWKLGRP